MQLYSYFRSSAAYRVRIALAWKQLPYETIPVHLVKEGGQHRQAAYAALNPQGLLPALVDNGAVMAQSMAILEYLEETHPEKPLLPKGAVLRAEVRAFAQHIACEIHPLNNLRVLQYLTKEAGLSEDAKLAWYKRWIADGFSALERDIEQRNPSGPYCFGEQLTFADVCLIPQVYNALRFQCDMGAYPHLTRINEACNALEAFTQAHPSNQPDAE